MKDDEQGTRLEGGLREGQGLIDEHVKGLTEDEIQNI